MVRVQKPESMAPEFQSITEAMRRTPTSVKSESGTNKNSAASGGCSGIEAKKLKTVSNYQFQTTSNKKKMSLRTKSVMQIRLNYYTDPDPVSGNPPYKSGSKEKLLIKFNFSKFCGKNLLTNMEKQLYIKLTKVPRGQLRSQKSCKDP